MAIRNWKDIPLFKDVTDEQWNDWHWQVSPQTFNRRRHRAGCKPDRPGKKLISKK